MILDDVDDDSSLMMAMISMITGDDAAAWLKVSFFPGSSGVTGALAP